jgi:hypothetical protein
MVLLPYPQFSGSFAIPGMQFRLDKELSGKEQVTKSARICDWALPPGFGQRPGSARTYASACAN